MENPLKPNKVKERPTPHQNSQVNSKLPQKPPNPHQNSHSTAQAPFPAGSKTPLPQTQTLAASAQHPCGSSSAPSLRPLRPSTFARCSPAATVPSSRTKPPYRRPASVSSASTRALALLSSFRLIMSSVTKSAGGILGIPAPLKARKGRSRA